METNVPTLFGYNIRVLETKYRDIADGNFLPLEAADFVRPLETKYRDIADSKQVY